MKARRAEHRGSSARQAMAEEGRPLGRDGRQSIQTLVKVFNERVWQAVTCSLGLSPRELQLVRGVFEDCTDFSIASGLGISSHTVHTHFERLHQKLGVANRAQLILRVMDEFLALTAAPGSLLPPVCSKRAAGRCPARRP